MHFKNKWKKQVDYLCKRGLILAMILTLLCSLVACSSEPDSSDLNQELTDSHEQLESIQTNNTQEQTTSSDQVMTVHFLDVGQGNSVLVECDGKYMLIDGGDYDYSSYVVAYLKSQGVETLEYMVVSHYDSDHLSGCVGALRAFAVETVICPDYVGDTKTYATFAKDVVTYANACVYPEVGDAFFLGDAMFSIVCPEEANYSDENDNSVGIRLAYGQNSFLICGDIGEEVEEDILKSGEYVQSQVYLASHHGSASSSTYDFLQAVQPEVVVVSCGYDNSYGHPAKATMNRLQKTGADLYRTDLQGSLIAVCDGTNITWNVDACNDFRCGEDVVLEGAVAKPEAENPNHSTNENATNNKNTDAINKATYILNTNSGKFHLPSCDSVFDMDESNKKEVTISYSELVNQGKSPCKRCLDE